MTRSVRIPADIDQEDHLLGSLTARQLVLVAIPAVVLWGLYMATRGLIPLVVFAPFAVIVSGVVGGLVVGCRDGLSMDRFVLAAIRHSRTLHELVPAPEGVIAPPGFVTGVPHGSPSSLDLPVHDVDADGVVDLGSDGAAIIATATSVNFSLQSETDQEALSEAFGRFCNSLQEPVQFLVRAERVDLTAAIHELQHVAPGLASIGLERAARDHAAFLLDIAGRHDVLTQKVLVVLHDPRPIVDAAEHLRRRAQEAIAGLRPAGVDLKVLGQDDAVRAIQSACDPAGSSGSLVDTIAVTANTVTGGKR